MSDETTGSPGEGPPSYPGAPDKRPGAATGHARPGRRRRRRHPCRRPCRRPSRRRPTAAPPSYPGPAAPGRYPVGAYAPGQGQFPPYDGAGGMVGAPYASWGIRLGGYLIDFVIFIPVFVVLALAVPAHARR